MAAALFRPWMLSRKVLDSDFVYYTGHHDCNPKLYKMSKDTAPRHFELARTGLHSAGQLDCLRSKGLTTKKLSVHSEPIGRKMLDRFDSPSQVRLGHCHLQSVIAEQKSPEAAHAAWPFREIESFFGVFAASCKGQGRHRQVRRSLHQIARAGYLGLPEADARLLETQGAALLRISQRRSDMFGINEVAMLPRTLTASSAVSVSGAQPLLQGKALLPAAAPQPAQAVLHPQQPAQLQDVQRDLHSVVRSLQRQVDELQDMVRSLQQPASEAIDRSSSQAREASPSATSLMVARTPSEEALLQMYRQRRSEESPELGSSLEPLEEPCSRGGDMEGPHFEPPRKRGDFLSSRPRLHGSRYVDALPDVDQQLENSIVMGDLAWVKDCIKKGANVNCRLDEKGFTPLMLASEGGWANIVRYLVENTDVEMDAVDSGGFNAADIAALNGYLSWEERGKNADVADIVNYLKDRGLEYTWRGAVIGGDIDRINEFLENGQDIEERTGYYCEGNYQYTAFQMAMKFGRQNVARYLLCLGAVIPRDICETQIPFESELRGFT
ncbi:DNA-binding protein RFXANK [Symbiodinium microadriaticum]|uniref:DNA-binding protein RFXANK n=1 Tax=Symbiodinium microadriaticum TaxID=2951 RepID=A0A1Q9E0M4_SYMMI|nr:DNA-binding protein RFXANK [Symbiodinium microadriaticum]CAE7706369.1 ANKRA2 [Symbiodinium microadriaticum]CAE7848825.1 ANKRA2 [Symbiodinium sp. KB8]